MSEQQSSESYHERMVEIETKLAYQEDLLQSLNEIVIQQRESIELLERKLNKINDRTLNHGGREHSAESEPPPHY